MHTTDTDAGTGHALMGFVAGFIGGAVVALLYAPSSGRDTREYLSSRARDAREKGEHLRDTAMQQGREVVEQGRAAMERGRDALSGAINKGRDAYRETKEAI